jgi:hypothetical protein
VLRPDPMSTQPSKADQLEKRLIAFSATIVSLSSTLPRTRKAAISAVKSSAPAPPPQPITAKHEAQKAEPTLSTNSNSFSRSSTKRQSGSISSPKARCSRQKHLSRLSRKTANFAALSPRRSKLLALPHRNSQKSEMFCSESFGELQVP